MHVCSKLEKMKSDFVRGSTDGRRNCIISIGTTSSNLS
jgi:hypothetical protein